MTSGKSDLIDIACEIHHTTDKAVQVFDGDKKVWLPKSQIEFERGDNGGDTVTLPEWLAHDKGLI